MLFLNSFLCGLYRFFKYNVFYDVLVIYRHAGGWILLILLRHANCSIFYFIHPASQPASSLIQFRPAERGAGAYPSFWERCRVCQDAVTWQYKPPLYPYYKSNSVTVCLCTCNESQTKPALNHWWKGPTTVKESSRKCDFMKYIKDKIKRWILHLLVDKNLTAGSFLLLM